MAESNNRRRQHREDRYAQKLRFYEGFMVLSNKVSRANGAVIWIAAIHTAGFPALAVAKAPWFSYLILLSSSVVFCSFAVWREKNAKPKQKEFSGTSPPQF